MSVFLIFLLFGCGQDHRDEIIRIYYDPTLQEEAQALENILQTPKYAMQTAENASPATENVTSATESATPATESAAPATDNAAPATDNATSSVANVASDDPAASTEAQDEISEPAVTGIQEEKNEKSYVLNTNTMKFHLPTCSSAAKIKPSNRSEFFGNREEVISAGYSPCMRCHA